ncbi:MAG: hypothetical protein U0525_05520 [Patescibacteria group bacterium]
MAEAFPIPSGPLKISQVTSALLTAIKSIKPKSKPDEYTKINVSRAVTFFAILYERVRNAIEYTDEHLVRRAAIERISRRRLSMNSRGEGEGENILKELLWARYFPQDSMSEKDIVNVQNIIDIYTSIKDSLIPGRDGKSAKFLEEFLFDLMTCEIEEILSQDLAQRENIFTYFIFQTLKDKIQVQDLDKELQNAYLLTAIEKTYLKSDKAYQRYHLFQVFYDPLGKTKKDKLTELSAKLPQIFEKIDDTLKNPMVEKLCRFVKKQLPPFLILFSMIKSKTVDEMNAILSDKGKLWAEVDTLCRKKYAATSKKLQSLAIKSIIYIFVTKMIFAILLEGPLSQYFYHEIDWVSITINSVFPPILMLIIILTTHSPGRDNTKRIYQTIVDIVDADPTFENKIVLMAKRMKPKKPILQFGLSVFYTATFVVTLYVIYIILKAIKFNLISMAIFIFFVSTVAFFSHRIKLVTSEYKLLDKDSLITPFIDFFFMPILAMGKFFSNEVAKLNFFTFIFDVLIEAPYKLLIEIIEEWISFTRKKKEEII